MSRPRCAVLLLTVGALLLAGCTLGPSQRPALATAAPGELPPPTSSAASSSAAPPSGAGGAPRTADPADWSDCTDLSRFSTVDGTRYQVDCATVRPDGSGLAGASIEIARARAMGVPPEAPALVVVSGAPGQQPAAEVVAAAAGLSPAVRDAFAVVTVDLSGTGPRGVLCLGSSGGQALLTMGADPTAPEASALLAEQSRAVTFQCGDEVGPELTSINTTTASDQLDAVRSALGEPGLRFLGRGWGATLGAVYADRFPGTVTAMVLDGPSDPLSAATDRAVAVAGSAESAFDTFAAACRARTDGCPLGDDPRGRISQLVADLDQANPPGVGRITGGSVLLDLMLALGDPDDWTGLADRIAAVTTDRTDLAGQAVLTDLAGRLGLLGDIPWTTPALVYACNDSDARLSADQLSAAAGTARGSAPLFGAFTVGLLGWCSSWPAPDAALGALRANGAPPMLVLSASGDPLAPAPEVQSLAGQLGSARLVTWTATRSGSYPAGSCVAGIVDAYLVSDTVPAADTLCPP